MTTIAAILLTAWFWQPADAPPELIAAITHVESRGNPLARNACCSGLMQVSRRFARVPEWALYVPAINRAEGWRILTRWRRRCRGDLTCALRAYATGNRALREPAHGRPYAVAVLRRMK